MYTQQVGYGSIPGWYPHCRCRYRHQTDMCHKYHVKHTSEQFNLDSSFLEKSRLFVFWLSSCLTASDFRKLFFQGDARGGAEAEATNGSS